MTRQFFLAIRCAVRLRHTVTVGKRPSGTLATVTPMKNTTAWTRLYPMASDIMKKVPPVSMKPSYYARQGKLCCHIGPKMHSLVF